MDEVEQVAVGGRRLDTEETKPAARLQLALDRHDPRRPLRVHARVVLERRRVRQQGRRRHGATVPAVPAPTRIDADVAVVGAGGAGLYTALAAAEHGAQVALVSATP